MTSIEWTDETWNPLRARRLDGTGKLGWACVRVSQGCVNCYAATQNRSTRAVGGTGLDYTVPDLAKVETVMQKGHLDKPLHWRAPRRVFVCSMTDLFGEWVTDQQIGEVFDVMARARQHTFQVLTKRPERMRAWITDRASVPLGTPKLPGGYGWLESEPWPLPNVWLGTSVEDQKAADERIPHLLATPAAVRFLSCEPLLGPVDLTPWLHRTEWCKRCDKRNVASFHVPDELWVRTVPTEFATRVLCIDCFDSFAAADGISWSSHAQFFPVDAVEARAQVDLDWVIVGGESGPRARPMDLAWARSLVTQCHAAGVAPFVKQLGSNPMGRTMEFAGIVDGSIRGTWTTAPFPIHESHGRDLAEWPEDLRVREWPAVPA